jgi:hypothetical protein
LKSCPEQFREVYPIHDALFSFFALIYAALPLSMPHFPRITGHAPAERLAISAPLTGTLKQGEGVTE